MPREIEKVYKEFVEKSQAVEKLQNNLYAALDEQHDLILELVDLIWDVEKGSVVRVTKDSSDGLKVGDIYRVSFLTVDRETFKTEPPVVMGCAYIGDGKYTDVVKNLGRNWEIWQVAEGV